MQKILAIEAALPKSTFSKKKETISMKLSSLSLCILTTAASPLAVAHSQIDVQDCTKAGIGIATLMTPAAKHSRYFYNGAVQVYNVNVDEPVGRSAAIAIVMPFLESDGPGASCTAVTFFSGIDVMKAKSSYDRSKGLLLTIPFRIYDPQTGVPKPSPTPLKIRIDRIKNSVVIE